MRFTLTWIKVVCDADYCKKDTNGTWIRRIYTPQDAIHDYEVLEKLKSAAGQGN